VYNITDYGIPEVLIGRMCGKQLTADVSFCMVLKFRSFKFDVINRLS
jgi:hypothetical protein